MAESLPPDWTGLPTTVERLDENGAGTGEFVTAWQVGNAVGANSAGYFPVPDEPAGNTFAMVNDDAPPCDCAMADVSLFSPFIDLAGAGFPALSYRVYHDGLPFNGDASLWASFDGSSWTLLEEIPPMPGAWQQRTTDLSDFASGPVQLRFTYDDGGQWASGFALDDVCVFDRLPHDVALSQAWVGDATVSAFNTGTRSLGYSRIPIEQQSPLRLSARIRNNGTSVAGEVQVVASISLNGATPVEITTTVATTLAPLQDTLVSWETGYLAAEAGSVSILLTTTAIDQDEEPSDNSAQVGFAVTSTSEGNHTMALDNDLASAVCGTDAGFSAGCRYELISGSSAVHGISVRFGAGTLPGSRVQALLMDGNLNSLSGSSNHTITDADLELSFAGGSVYIPLDSTFAVVNEQDVIGLVRCLPDSGALRVASGGVAALGSSLLIDATTFSITYPGTTPIVRIHFSDAVTGLSNPAPSSSILTIAPGAAEGTFVIHGVPVGTHGPLEVLDVAGRLVERRFVRPDGHQIILSMQGNAPGLYRVMLHAAEGISHRWTGAFVLPRGL